MANYAYWAEALTGGANGALDAIDGSDLVDKDMAIVAASASSTSYIYWLDEDNAGAESSPTIIAPDNNGGDKRWVLIGQIFPNTGLKILDTNSSHTLNITPGSDLSANRTLTVTTGDADRTLTLGGNFRNDVDQAVAIASDKTTVTAPGRATLTSESSTADDLTEIDGLLTSEKIVLKAATGHTITVKSGAKMVLQGDIDFPLTGNKRLWLESDDADVCVELSRTRD